MMVGLSHAWEVVDAFIASLTDVKVASVAAVIAIFAITWPNAIQWTN
jgi:hypothetical protein